MNGFIKGLAERIKRMIKHTPSSSLRRRGGSRMRAAPANLCRGWIFWTDETKQIIAQVPLVCAGYLPEPVRNILRLRDLGLTDKQVDWVLKQDKTFTQN